MQNYQFSLIAQQRPETLERILRVIRHRGFQLDSMEMQQSADNIYLKIVVKSDRSLNLLTHQLEKLIDVKQLTIK